METILKFFPEFTPKQRTQMGALAAVYGEWNAKINVISRKDIDGLYERHVLHSLAIARAAAFAAHAHVVDIGTGGGFPGIPLAIAFPQTQFWLVESVGKKIRVVREVVRAVGLKNVTAVHARIESFHGHQFDFAVVRAVAALGDLWKWAKPLLRPGTKAGQMANGLLCLKGGDLGPEIAASGLQPQVLNVATLFPDVGFVEKYLMHVAR